MKRRPISFLGLASSLRLFVGIVAALVTLAGVAGHADEQVVRWDIIRLSPGPAVNPGGEAFAKATNANQSAETSMIKMTGSGTFRVPKKDREERHVTGGGTWMITTGSNVSGGTYEVTGVVRWLEAPGVPNPTTDNIGNPSERHAGLAVLRIEYNDGELGILVVSCSLVGSPATIFEGITASKGFTDFWKAQPPSGSPTTANANRTLFHVGSEEEEEKD